MRVGLTGRIVGASAALALVVCAGFAILSVSIRELRNAANQAHHSETVVATANRLEKLVLDLETGQRGYIVTRDERFLQPWREAHRTIGGASEQLVGLVAAEPAQLARARRIQVGVEEYIHDYSDPLVAQARRDPVAAAGVVKSAAGKRRVDVLRAQVARLIASESAASRAHTTQIDARATRATELTAAGLGITLALLLAFAVYIARAIVRPVRALSGAAAVVGRGDLAVRVPEGAVAELGVLGAGFNVMTASLEEARDELENQAQELELQTAELEEQHANLEEAHDELAAQRAELERALAAVAEEKERTEVFYEFGELIVREADIDALLESILRELADFAGAEVGVISCVTPESNGELRPAVARGIEFDSLASRGAGGALAARALAERRMIVADHGESGLEIRTLGAPVKLRHELHLPLGAGERKLGVITLARVGSEAFPSSVVEALEHLVDQASVALVNAFSLAESRRLVSINRALLDETPLGLRLVGLDGSILLENATFHRLLVTLPPEIDAADPDLRAEALSASLVDPQEFRAWYDRGQRDPLDSASLVVDLRDGRALEIYGAPVRDHDGALMGRLYVLRDVTAERAADKLKSELLATVSHELRTPLAGVLGFAELLSTREYDAETRQRYLDTIRGEATRLSGLVNDFLDLQRIEAGQLGLSLAPFELTELLREQVEVFSAISERHAVELELPERELQVMGDRQRILQVITNLLSNAIKYSPSGGTVTVRASLVDSHARVSVTDTGLGIPAEQQEGVFGKFFRAETSEVREIRGTGLGLAITREIVEAHGGRISFESVEGQGSTFSFELPAVGEQVAEQRRRRVLVVAGEDVARSLASQLESADYAVETEARSDAVVARVESAPPDLICLDVALNRGVNVWDLLTALKHNPRTRNIPVIVCAESADRARITSFGATDFLVKPFDPSQLRDALLRILAPGQTSILVVDDEPAIRRLVAAALADHEVREAGDGEEALRKIAARRPDAIVLDLGMPKLDGFDVLERLQQDEATKSIPVIVLTARELTPIEQHRLSRRAASLLTKSAYSADHLRAFVARAIGH